MGNVLLGYPELKSVFNKKYVCPFASLKKAYRSLSTKIEKNISTRPLYRYTQTSESNNGEEG